MRKAHSRSLNVAKKKKAHEGTRNRREVSRCAKCGCVRCVCVHVCGFGELLGARRRRTRAGEVPANGEWRRAVSKGGVWW